MNPGARAATSADHEFRARGWPASSMPTTR